MKDPWLSEASYWQPKHYPISAWVEHAPFAFWLVERLRPRTIVELGTHWGYSFFVFCEAVDRLGLQTRVYALDTWQGEEHAGRYGEEVFDYVKKISSSYPGVAHMVRGYFSDSVGEFADGSIDLLHIDGRHGYEDVRDDFAAYLPKLSERAVVVLHDIGELRPTFGVWRFWEEISHQFPSLSFPHNHGLGVLGVGSNLPHEARDLFDAAENSIGEIRAGYEELGGAVARRLVLEALPERLQALELERDRLRSQVHESENQRLGLQNQIDALHASSSWRLTRPLRSATSLFRRP